jgi:predicted DNA-binding protein
MGNTNDAQCAFRLPKRQKERLGALAEKMTQAGVGRVTETDLLREAVRRLLREEDPDGGA